MLWTGATLPFTVDAVRGRSVIAEALVQYQISMCWNCGAQIGSGTAFSPTASVSPLLVSLQQFSCQYVTWSRDSGTTHGTNPPPLSLRLASQTRKGCQPFECCVLLTKLLRVITLLHQTTHINFAMRSYTIPHRNCRPLTKDEQSNR